MIVGEICDQCKGAGRKIGAGYIMTNCSWCAGRGVSKKSGESDMNKILGQKKYEKFELNDLEKSVQNQISQMTTKELKETVQKQRGRPKKEMTQSSATDKTI